MRVVSKGDLEWIGRKLKNMKNRVGILYFTQSVECEFCCKSREMLAEISNLTDKLFIEVYDYIGDMDFARKHGVDKIPAVILLGERGYGLRFFGDVQGYQLEVFIDGIIDVSRGETDLPKAIKSRLREVKAPVHIQVFTTPTCPYSPSMLRLAHKFAVESEHIKADMVNLVEFPHLVHKYEISRIPTTVLNGRIKFEGALPTEAFLLKVLEASAVVC